MSKEQQNQNEAVEPVQNEPEVLVAEGEVVEPGAAEETEVSLIQQLEESRAEVDALKKELVELKPRAQAEIQNIRRRAEQDVEKAHKFGLEKFATELLPVVDSLERAIEASQGDEEKVKAIREGVEMTLGLFLSSLEKFNVEQLNPQGEVFNPEHHQAMSMVPAEGVEPNTVVTVVQKGYLLNGRLVRPAMVMVAKG
ncbi:MULTISPECIES: nucleotide exchange factor GrpE [Marinobacterium]|jgi:molecular chaperone GrpE|uniref:nucleotide exchange factor GrpE n=1 Tax=Marinobacterium TaxID=48075 RepID=UPI001A8FD7DA|nr:nucleotide exchange factor GrpE [Marinobacterium iners]QSR33741.1 nucleotide exchange factor GrpE [Marinobacterium iners]